MHIRPCVTVIIVTYQSASEISVCLNSLKEHAAEWISECRVVDNNSRDDSAVVAQSTFAGINVIRNSDNLGFSKAVNIGAHDAVSDYLLILNPDTQLQRDSLGELVHFLDHRREAAMCGPKMLGMNGEFQSVCRRSFPTPWNTLGYYLGLNQVFPKSRRWSSYKPKAIPPDTESKTEVLSGACMLIRREDFRKIGGFDEDYFLFGEDIDICWKLHQAGRELWYVPAAEVRHVKGASMKHALTRAKREFYRSMLIYIDKRLAVEYSFMARFIMKTGVRFRWLLGWLPGL